MAQRIAVVLTHGRSEDVRESAGILERVAAEFGVTVHDGDQDTSRDAEAEIAITLGGDGTILSALRRFSGSGIPVFAVNFGQVGFLATIDRTDCEDGFRRAFTGQFDLMAMPAVACAAPGLRQAGVNDVSLIRRPDARVAVLSYVLGGEELGRVRCDGIVVATPAGSTGYNLANGGPVLAWGVQAYFMRLANHTVRAESIFFYMMLGDLLLAPVALAMTDWSQPINTGIDGPWMTAAIQLLNAIGALTLVYAFRHGKAIVVAPLTNAGAPLVTAALALVFASVVPGPLKMIGLVLALIASLLLVLEPEAPAEAGHDPDVSTPSPEWTPTSCKSSPSSSPATSRDTPVA